MWFMEHLSEAPLHSAYATKYRLNAGTTTNPTNPTSVDAIKSGNAVGQALASIIAATNETKATTNKPTILLRLQSILLSILFFIIIC